MLKKDNERNRRREVAGKNRTKTERDNDRDISEKIALGQAQPTASRDALFDQRLFNQTSGLAAGFGDEDDYNHFDKPLFTDRTSASIYKNVNRETGQGNLAAQLSDDGEVDEVKEVLRQKPERSFEGTLSKDSKSQRSKPVEFEKRTMQEDSAFGETLGLLAPANKRARLN